MSLKAEFQPDNNLSYSRKSMRECFKKAVEWWNGGMEWPSHSPDLNPTAMLRIYSCKTFFKPHTAGEVSGEKHSRKMSEADNWFEVETM